MAADALEEDARDSDDIRGHKSRNGQGDNCIKGNCRSDVNKREENSDSERDEDGVERDVPARLDLLRSSVS